MLNMLKKIYYKLAENFFRLQVKSLGVGSKLRFQGRVLGGDYVHMAPGVEIEKGWTIAVYPEYGGRDNPVKLASDKGVWLGERGSYNRNLTIYCADSVKIGRDVMFGSYVLVTDNEHGTDPASEVPYRFQPLKTSPVEIGDECWIAEGVRILAGTRIGEKSIVAANAVVKGEFPLYAMIAGMPARVVRVWDFGTNKWVRPKGGQR